LNRIGQTKSIKVIREEQAVPPVRLLNIQPEKFLTKKFARRFVIGGVVKIRTTDRYVQAKARSCETPFGAPHSARTREIHDAKDYPDNSRCGLARDVDHADRRGRGAPQGPKG
jgi:hypothetical protein